MSRLNQIKYWVMAILVLACHLQLTQTKLMFAVKGQLIPDSWNVSDIERMERAYIKRLWGNCERLPRTLDRFEKEWEKANG